MVKRTVCLLALLLLAACSWLPAEAAYRFRVTRMKAWVQAENDGSTRISYDISFYAEPGSHPIDVVDIGMPNAAYRLATAHAEIGGLPCADIRHSQYVHPGIEVHLGPGTIMPGAAGTLRCTVVVDNQIFAASDEANAALEFKTTWFGPEYVSGRSDYIEVQLDLPPGSRPETSRFHTFGRADYTPTASRFENDRVSYAWRWENVRADTAYAAGASFPRGLVAHVYSPPKKSLLEALLELLMALLFFLLALLPILLPILIVVALVVARRRRLKHYLPPVVGVESGGIKRGLTPPEAALLQELPLPKVLLLVMYGMLRKELLEIKPAGEKEFRFHKRVPLPAGVELLPYEKDFLTAVSAENKLIAAGAQAMLTAMIKALQEKMRGFSRRETEAYYRSIMAKAWQQVQSAPADKLPAELADNLEWLTLDEEYEKKIGPLWPGVVFPPDRPAYWYHRLPYGAGPGHGPTALPGGGMTAAATRLVDAMQGFANALVGNQPAAFTAAVTQAINPPPVRSSSYSNWSGGSGSSHRSSSSGGGHSSCACACACACAGCACACAGGGR